jgi:hypothetical protein
MKSVHMNEDEEREMNERIEKVMKARDAIVAACGGPWKKGTPGSMGTIDCPVCGQPASLAFRRAQVNGHVHASCKTPGCVSWME